MRRFGTVLPVVAAAALVGIVVARAERGEKKGDTRFFERPAG